MITPHVKSPPDCCQKGLLCLLKCKASTQTYSPCIEHLDVRQEQDLQRLKLGEAEDTKVVRLQVSNKLLGYRFKLQESGQKLQDCMNSLEKGHTWQEHTAQLTSLLDLHQTVIKVNLGPLGLPPEYGTKLGFMEGLLTGSARCRPQRPSPLYPVLLHICTYIYIYIYIHTYEIDESAVHGSSSLD